MWVGLVVVSALMQPSSSGAANLSAQVVDAIDRNYLYADTDSWRRLRADFLSDAQTTVSSIEQQLAKLHYGDLRDRSRFQIVRGEVQEEEIDSCRTAGKAPQ